MKKSQWCLYSLHLRGMGWINIHVHLKQCKIAKTEVAKTLTKSLFPLTFICTLSVPYCISACVQQSTMEIANTSTVANTVINKNTFAVSFISSKPIITSTHKTARNICTCRVFWACSIQRAFIFIYMEMVKEINLLGFSISQS